MQQRALMGSSCGPWQGFPQAGLRRQVSLVSLLPLAQPAQPRRVAGSMAQAGAGAAARTVVRCAAAADAAGQTAHAIADGFPRTAVVGVLGGGQLGKMLGQEAVSEGSLGVWISLLRGQRRRCGGGGRGGTRGRQESKKSKSATARSQAGAAHSQP